MTFILYRDNKVNDNAACAVIGQLVDAMDRTLAILHPTCEGHQVLTDMREDLWRSLAAGGWTLTYEGRRKQSGVAVYVPGSPTAARMMSRARRLAE